MTSKQRETVLERVLARLDQLEQEKGRMAGELAAVRQALSAPPDAAPLGHASRRGLLKAALGVAAAAAGAGTALRTQSGTAQAASEVTRGQTTFSSNTSTPTVSIKNTGIGLGLSTANAVALGATSVTSLSASGASYGVVGSGTIDGGDFYSTAPAGSGHAGVYCTGDNGVYAVGASYGGQFSGNTTAGSGYAGVNAAGDIGVIGAGYTYGGDFYSTAPAGSGGKGVYCAGDIGLDAYGATWAGFFIGNVEVTGTLSKSGGSFKIDHPLDPAHQYLSHSFVESPDMLNIYNGIAVLDAQGQAVVDLPAWFDTLNTDCRYQLTPLGAAAGGLYISQEVANNQFAIAGGMLGLRVSWQVTGIRQDPWATANRIVVEEPKPDKEQGTYLYPQGYGAPESQGLAALHRPPQPPTPPKAPALPASAGA